MVLGKRRRKDARHREAPIESVGEEVVDSAKVPHGRYTIIPRVKQLINGQWIVRITLEEEVVGGMRSYDFAGPMSEFETRDEAVRGGIEHAKQRLDESN